MSPSEQDENQDFEKSDEEEFAESMKIQNLLNQPKVEKVKQPKVPKDLIVLDKTRENILLKTVSNYKHRLVIILMLDCGLRITETVTLKMKDFDFRKKLIMVKSLKKRAHESYRKIPMSARVLEAMAEYLKHNKTKKEEDYLFAHAIDETKPMTRFAANTLLRRLKKRNPAIGRIHPHALRHTFATKLLATGTPLHDVSKLLGHNNYNTTLIYNHTPIELLRKSIENANSEHLTWYQKIYRKFFPKKYVGIINYNPSPNNFIVGREKEIIKIIDLVNKNVNVILTGKIGIGKTHILKQIETTNKTILKIDELTNLKLTFVNLLLFLLDNDKETIKEMLFPGYDKSQILQRLQRDSVYNLIEEILKITKPHEYILYIENVDGITAKGIKCIELLKDHFTIITTARQVAINKSSFLWNFEIVKIEPLPRPAALELIHRLSYDIEVEDMELFRNHIYDQSAGNPRVIFELCERYRKEIVVTNDIVRQVKHIGGIPEIDMSFIIVFILAGVAVMRYTSREIGGTSYRFIGGMALVLMMIFRFFLSKMKRKNL